MALGVVARDDIEDGGGFIDATAAGAGEDELAVLDRVEDMVD